jgi:ATP-binding cassette subfamily B protein
MQQAYASWSSIRAGQTSLQDTLDLLDQPLPSYAGQPIPKPIKFNKAIRLNQLGFSYDQNKSYVLKQINLSILKGSRVGFIGATGSGKTTLLDIVMGLLQPSEGCLEIDGEVITPANQRAWQTHIAHVPQAIYLADSTIEENIAFGVPKEKIDFERVRHAAHKAQVAEVIDSWPLGYQTLVGERGICLSGGQRQRIGIARALYKQADVIIFDEATSALDSETEQAVMHAIDALSNELTLFIIAHRLTTLKSCNLIVELGGGSIKRTGSYNDIVNHS